MPIDTLDRLKITRLYSDLDLGFELHPVTGDISRKTDVNAVKQALKILVLTNFYERPFAPSMGGNIRGLLFEHIDSTTAAVIEKTITQLITSYEPRAKLEAVDVIVGSDGVSYVINIRYYVVGFSAPQKLFLELERLR